MALGSVRRWASLVAISAAVAVAASGGASSGAATVLPVVTVSPSTGLVDLQKKMYSESIRAIDKSVKLAFTQQGRQMYIYAIAGRPEEAKAMAARFSRASAGQDIPEYYLAATHLALGDPDRAFRFLDRAYSKRDFMLPFLRSDPIWDEIRGDKRFRALLARMNFPPR